jgi:hypothetical protein
MARPKGTSLHDPEAIAYAVEAVRAGRSTREIAAELAELDVHVSHMTVKRWSDAAGKGESSARPAQKAGASSKAEPVTMPRPPEATPPPSAPPPAQAPSLAERVKAGRERAAAAAPPAPEADPNAPFDFEASLQRMIRQAEGEAKAHELASNPRGAQAAMRRAAELMKVLSQSEKRKPTDPDVLTFSKGEIDAAYSAMTGTLEQLMQRPVLCSSCSRDLSVKFGRGQG